MTNEESNEESNDSPTREEVLAEIFVAARRSFGDALPYPSEFLTAFGEAVERAVAEHLEKHREDAVPEVARRKPGRAALTDEFLLSAALTYNEHGWRAVRRPDGQETGERNVRRYVAEARKRGLVR